MSNRSKEVKPVASMVVSWESLYQLLPLLEETRDDVWLSKTCQCQRYTLRGVPAKHVDVLVDMRLVSGSATEVEALHPLDVMHCTIVHKIGRFDGAERDRITIRISPVHSVKDLTRGEVYVYESANDESVLVADLIADPVAGVEPTWTARYTRLKSDLTEHNPQAIVLWHWCRYYQHLSYEVAQSVADEWAVSGFDPDWTLAEANRSASRALYRASRNEGFRKLTMRERVKHNRDGGQWQRSDSFANHSGCGEATIQAASGQPVELTCQHDD